MKRLVLFLILVSFAPGSLGADIAAREAKGGGAFAAAAAGLCSDCRIAAFERETIAGDLRHDSAILVVGPGPHDRIGIHRVYDPGRRRHKDLRDAILLAHGINVGFVGTFLANTLEPDLDQELALPIFLARDGVDVWGIDFRWTLVDGDVEDISFMADWGLERDAADLRIALAAARITRLAEGRGWRTIDLLGYSRGGRIGYTYLNDESQWPRGLRHVDRFVQLDSTFKSIVPGGSQEACALIPEIEAQIADGDVADDNRVLAALGRLALDAPDAPSPFFAGMTNRQVALLFLTLPSGSGTFHFFGGVFEDGMPVDFAYTAERALLNLVASTEAFQPLAGFRDLLIVLCDSDDDALDDHLEDVVVPVRYIGAAGGNRDFGVATFDFLGSKELSSEVVALRPPGEELFDVGHGDLLLMDRGAELVWQPILDWVRAR